MKDASSHFAGAVFRGAVKRVVSEKMVGNRSQLRWVEMGCGLGARVVDITDHSLTQHPVHNSDGWRWDVDWVRAW